MPAHPARPMATLRIQPDILTAAAALATTKPHSHRLAETLWDLADQALKQQPPEKDTDK